MTGNWRVFDIAVFDLSLIFLVFAFRLSEVCGRSGLLIPESTSPSALDRFVAPFFGGLVLFTALLTVCVVVLDVDVFDLLRGFNLDDVTSSFAFFDVARSTIEVIH